MKTISILLLGIVGLIGCANKPPIDVKSVDYKTKKVETAISQIPKWFLEIPKDEENVYSTGTGVAPDLQRVRRFHLPVLFSLS